MYAAACEYSRRSSMASGSGWGRSQYQCHYQLCQLPLQQVVCCSASTMSVAYAHGSTAACMPAGSRGYDQICYVATGSVNSQGCIYDTAAWQTSQVNRWVDAGFRAQNILNSYALNRASQEVTPVTGSREQYASTAAENEASNLSYSNSNREDTRDRLRSSTASSDHSYSFSGYDNRKRRTHRKTSRSASRRRSPMNQLSRSLKKSKRSRTGYNPRTHFPVLPSRRSETRPFSFRAALNPPTKLYHYTDSDGAFGILNDNFLISKENAVAGTDSARFGAGIYFTDIPPAQKTESILRNNYGKMSFSQAKNTEFCFEFSGTKLPDLVMCDDYTTYDARYKDWKRSIWMSRVEKLDLKTISTGKYFVRELNGFEVPNKITVNSIFFNRKM